MIKVNRRTFLCQMGCIATGTVAHSAMISPQTGITTSISNNNNTIKKRLTDHGRALVNPDMGWTMHFYSNLLSNYGSKLKPADTLDQFPGLSTVYLRIPWIYVQPEKNQFIWETLDTPAQRWIEKGKKVAIRITATEHWMRQATPQWVFDSGAVALEANGYIEPDYANPVFLKEVENFVRIMAERYDKNPNIAFIDVGHYGMWGEGHTVMTSPIHGKTWGIEIQKQIIDIYCKHFKNTLLCISDDFAGDNLPGKRFPITDYAFSKGITIRDDSILVQPYPKQWYHSDMAQLFWPTLPVILEHEHYHSSMARKAWDKELLLQSVEEYHASYMSIHGWPEDVLNENADVIDRINKRLGYRLQLRNIEWPSVVYKNEHFSIYTEWNNAGVAPCYPGGYPCFTIKDKENGIVAVLVDTEFNVRELPVSPPDKINSKLLNSGFIVAPVFSDNFGSHARTCKTDTYELYISVGLIDGTPIFELPYSESDGNKRYRVGKIQLKEK